MDVYKQLGEEIKKFEQIYLFKMWATGARNKFNQNKVRKELGKQFIKIQIIVSSINDEEIQNIWNDYHKICFPLTYYYQPHKMEYLNIWLETDLLPKLKRVIYNKLNPKNKIDINSGKSSK